MCIRDSIYIKLPPEDHRAGEEGICGKLLKSLYGTRDAGANWHLAYSSFLQRIGMTQGTANPCHFREAGRNLRGLVHGDDFIFTGTRQNLEWLRKHFEDEYACKIEIIGYGPDVASSARFLNMVITFTRDGVDFEADQRLAEAIVQGMDLQDSSTAAVPGTKPKPIPKAEHQKMMERRLGGEDGRNCVIANLKAQVGQLEKALKEALELRADAKVAK